MPRVGVEPTIPIFERAKTVHALDRAVTVIACCGGIDWINLAHNRVGCPALVNTLMKFLV
jgi:hypothetical protein